MQHDVTKLSMQLSRGNQGVGDEIFPLIYDELKKWRASVQETSGTRDAESRFGKTEERRLNENIYKEVGVSCDLVALRNLAEVDPPPAMSVVLRFFGAHAFERTAEVLGISPRTANAADSPRARLYRKLNRS